MAVLCPEKCGKKFTTQEFAEYVLNETETLNATILEFNFRAVADQISFRYIFASEEYQEGNSSTCQYSDLFGFLIRPENETRYENIALVPGTQTPVKVTTVHSGIPGSCNPINEAYFGSWNNSSAPINFNGQTAILTAVASVIPNETYHVKLVIADEHNYRYDSAVFLEAGSFELNTNLGPDKLIANNTALCPDENLLLDASSTNATNYKWFQNGVEILGETNPTYLVENPGTYSLEATINSTCISYGDVVIERATNPVVFDTNLISCDFNLDGLTNYNLFDAEAAITNNDSSIYVENFYLSQTDAEAGITTDAIQNPDNYNNTSPNQIVFARVLNANGCFSVAQVTLNFANNNIILPEFPVCDDDLNDGITTFNLTDVEAFILNQTSVPNSANISFFTSQTDLENQSNPVSGSHENINNPYTDTLFVQITDNGTCFAYTSINLVVNPFPELEEDEETFYCLNTFPQTITLEAGVLSGSNLSYLWSTGETTQNIQINQIGTYSVTVTNNFTCFNTRSITVLPSNTATIDDVLVSEGSSNNSITINASGEGDYEYALDDGSFQDSHIFTHVSAGYHTVYVQDKNGCGVIPYNVSVLGFPKFFTPNGDSYNETWKPIGINLLETNVRVQIFDRYGKLLKELDALDSGWNGTFNGDLLPTNDYWFIITLTNGKQYRGHFTLKR